MATLIGLTGWNHGIASVTGTGSVDTTTVRRVGGSSLRLNPTAGVSEWFGAAGAGSPSGPGKANLTVYFNYATFPGNQCPVAGVLAQSGDWLGVAYDPTTGQLIPASRVSSPSFINAPFGPVLSTGVWYRLEVSADMSTATYAWDARVAVGDGSATLMTHQTQGTIGGDFVIDITLGNTSTIDTSDTFDVYFTDCAWSNTAADYPIGPITVRGYSPNGVGTHNLDAATSQFFFKNNGSDTALTTSETTSYQNIDEIPVGSSSDDIRVESITSSTTISRIGVANSATTTVTVPAHAVGDLILIFAYETGSATVPTVPAGYTSLGNFSNGGSPSSRHAGVLGYKIATATNDTSGTWTGATNLVCMVYRGCATPTSGDVVLNSGSSASIDYPALTVSDHTNSWVAAFVGTASSGGTTAPTGLTNRTGATTRGGHDSGAPFGADWSDRTVAVSSERWGTAVIELKNATTVTQPTNTWYAEYTFPSESVITTDPLGLSFVGKLSLVGGGGASIDVRLNTSGGDIVGYSGSIGSSQTFSVIGSLTLTHFNTKKLRFGQTNSATGKPLMTGAIVEAAFFPPATPPTRLIQPMIVGTVAARTAATR
jgi:hypothetical protein